MREEREKIYNKVKNYKETILLHKELRAENLDEMKRLVDKRRDIQNEYKSKH